MRLILAVVLLATPLLLVGGYLEVRDRIPRVAPPESRLPARRTERVYQVELTLTFAAEADVFSEPPVALVVHHHGKPIFTETGAIALGETVEIPGIEQLQIGKHEFYIEATPSAGHVGRANALRIRIVRDDGQVMSEETIWSEPGGSVRGRVELEVADEGGHDDHE